MVSNLSGPGDPGAAGQGEGAVTVTGARPDAQAQQNLQPLPPRAHLAEPHGCRALQDPWLELATAGRFDGQGDHRTPPAYVEKAFRKYLECGILYHGFARLPVRKWVLSVPKRLRYYLQRDKGALNAALRIFLWVVQQSLLSA